jgi:DNA-binding transcriptional ArsR family regulator
MDVFEALAAPTRREIIEMLASKKELSATAIYAQFDASPSAISQHLKVLRETKLVEVEVRGQQRLYRIDPEGIEEIDQWSQRMTRLWNKRFDVLDRVLASEKKKNQKKGK